MSAVNLLSELLDVRARRFEISGYNTNEIDCLISSFFLFLLSASYYFILYYAVRFHTE